MQAALDEFPTGELDSRAGISVSDDLILGEYRKIVAHYPLLPFPEEKQDECRYFYQNSAFSYGDALAYFGLLLEYKPKRVIEIGSGYSSCLLMDTNERFFNSKIEATFIEPYPELLHSLIRPDDAVRYRILPGFLQEVPTAEFEALEANDILFIDSSHVLKTASDVNDYLFRILPALRKGVLIHIHDIPYPFEYGPNWIVAENRSWNEAYALRAFLQYNSAFEIIYFSHYMYRKHEQLLKQTPMALLNCGASIWLRKRSN